MVLGYSWKTNQYGLAIDTITAYELVKPDGNVVTVTEASDPELFFGLKVVLFYGHFSLSLLRSLNRVVSITS
jgi:hypothetical protein